MFAEDEHREREFYGDKTADEHQKERHARSREAYRNRYQRKPEESPSEEQMDEKREERRKTQKTGRIKIAEVDRRFEKPIQFPTTAYDLYDRMVGQRVAELERDLAGWAS
jgi:hypothetical protein